MTWITHRKCTKCKQIKSIHEFHKDRTQKDGYKNRCKKCVSEYRKKRYRKVDVKRNKVKTARNKKFIAEYLLTHPCVDCGETDPVVLQFDHVYGTKKSTISYLVHKAVPIEKIVIEMRKCEVRCANCHIRRHAYERGMADIGKYDD